MFSGIIEETATVVSLKQSEAGSELVIESALDHSSTNIGDSIAVDGCCLTVVRKETTALCFELASETLRCTTLGDVRAGDQLNLERSLRAGARLHGHFVMGHVDGTACLLRKRLEGDTVCLMWEIPEGMACYIAPKGSVAVAGVSLTIGEVTEKSFVVYIIPHTLSATSLSTKNIGDRVNLEVDPLARYVVHALQHSQSKDSRLSLARLKEFGFVENDS